jgi:hypothetical protein
VNEQVAQHSLHIDHLMIRSELKYLIGGKVGMLKWRVCGAKTGPFPEHRVFHAVRPISTVQMQVELEPEPTRHFGPVGNHCLVPVTKYTNDQSIC